MNIKTVPLKQIKLTAHFIQRAKERLKINIDNNTLEYEIKLKELVQNAEFNEFTDNSTIKYELIYNNERYYIWVHKVREEWIIKTITNKGK